jgi:GNAT superfamily N-acetyltransferase
MMLPDGRCDVPAGKVAAVITHLEMTARPAQRPVPSGPWTLRKVQAPGVDWYRELYRRVGQDWLWIARLRMADAELITRLQSPQVEIHAVVNEGRDEGLLELDFRDAGACEIVFFGVTANLVGTGAGRWLMNRALELAWSWPIKRLWLNTCTFDHPSALAFYQRSGFHAFRRQIVILDDPRLDGTVPRHVATHVPIIEPTTDQP